MRVFFLLVLALSTAAQADAVSESIERSRGKLRNTPIVESAETKAALQARQDEQEKKRVEHLVPPARPAPALEKSTEQKVLEDLRSRRQ